MFHHLSAAIESKQFKIAESIVSRASELFQERSIIDNYIKFEELTTINCDKQDYERLLVKFLNISNPNLNEKLIISVIKGDVDSVVSLLQGVDFLLDNNLAIYAISRRNIDVRYKLLRLLIEKELDIPKVHDHQGNNLLPVFLRKYAENTDGDLLKIVKLLIDCGVPVDEADFYGHTIILQSTNLIKFLVQDKEMDVNAKTAADFSPLNRAVRKLNEVNFCIIELLVEKGADVNAKDCYGRTAVELAKTYNKTIFFNFLIDNGAILLPKLDLQLN